MVYIEKSNDIKYNCKIAIKNVFKEYLKPFKYLNGECIKKDCINPKIFIEFKKIADYYNIKYNNDDDLIEKLTNHLKCTHNTISCLIDKIINSSEQFNIDENILYKQVDNLKPPGPFDSNEWFSNINIDSILEQFEDLFKDKHFLHVYFHMRDYKKANTDTDEKKNLNILKFSEYYEKGIRCFGVVFNTDVSSGSGEHWFSIFGDFSQIPFTIEHFNSSGDTPLPEIYELMCDIKHEMIKYLHDKNITSNKKIQKNINTDETFSEYYENKDYEPSNEIICKKSDDKINIIKCINVTEIVNQSDNHSCGSYSLFYILCRLCGISYKIFEKNKIGDKLMHEFRRNIFSHNY